MRAGNMLRWDLFGPQSCGGNHLAQSYVDASLAITSYLPVVVYVSFYVCTYLPTQCSVNVPSVFVCMLNKYKAAHQRV